MSKRIHQDAKPCNNLDGFIVKRILKNDSKSKVVHVLGNFKDDPEDAIVSMVKTPFSEDTISKILSGASTVKKEFVNDAYGQYQLYTKSAINMINTQIIKPATEKHVLKFTEQQPFLFYETVDMYEKITKPYLEKQSFSIQWVYNILDHKTESERIIYEDEDEESGYILLPDLKWDTHQIEDLHVIAIVNNRNITSIRDLTATHLPLLKKIMNKGMDTISKKYGVPSTQIRAYFHYYPSYYHLHVHFSHLMFDAGGTTVEKAHLLRDVIDNIEQISDDFYSKKTLSVALCERDPLLQLLKDAGEP